jgi:hypothetical protein
MQSSRFVRRGRCSLLATALILMWAGGAPAAPGDPACLARKLKEWGKLRSCQAVQAGKAMRGLPADTAKCQLKLVGKLSAITVRAARTGTPCRFGDTGSGTVIDYDTGLEWEQKTDDGGVHDTDNTYGWSSGSYYPDFTYPDGTLFVDFLGRLDTCASDGTNVAPAFAGHCDWRIPTLAELLGMADWNLPGCGTLSGHCIDESVFGPAHPVPDGLQYWSSSIVSPTPEFPNSAWGADLHFPSSFLATRNLALKVRAVRSAL